MTDRWPPGTPIVQEEYWRQQLVTVRPVTVVEDSSRLLALFSHAGAVCLSGAMPARASLPLTERLRVYMSDEQPTLEPRPVRANVLTLTPPGASHAVWLFWDAAWTLRNWYVNLQAPFTRLPHGIRVSDHLLDLILTPDLAWSWKDADEFEAVCAAGAFTPAQRDAIRAEAQRLIARIERRAPPFNEPWPAWRPDPAWPVPTLPADWQPHASNSGQRS